MKLSKGFTLIEIVIVIAIIGILGVITIPNLTGYTQSAHEHEFNTPPSKQ